ncbi:MAG: DUF2779 domain-containing protein [Anaerolineaceae bacterium]
MIAGNNQPRDSAQQFLLTKTHFRQYLDSPLHLWASIHTPINPVSSSLSSNLQRQGYEVETQAVQFLKQRLGGELSRDLLQEQMSFVDGNFFARADLIVRDADSEGADLYEIKASTNVKPEHLKDCAFQYLVISTSIPLRNVFLVLLDGNYRRGAELDVEQLFQVENVTDLVLAELESVENLRQAALDAALQDNPDKLQHCYTPKDCPCPQLCYPLQVPLSIYEIPGLHKTQKLKLEALGVFDARDVPDDFPLSNKQRGYIKTVRAGTVHVDRAGIQKKLAKLRYPLHFLDYESYGSAIPLFEGYRPYQEAVFQFSLDSLEDSTASPMHREYVHTGLQEPSRELLSALQAAIASEGSVLVWNKSFEMTRNREMAALHPQFASFLEDLNERIVDLAESIKEGLYIHPGLRGSWSIKKVLPVLDPEGQDYPDLEISEGRQASEAWWEMLHSEDTEKKEALYRALLNYCALDTQAMVRVFYRLTALVS